MADISIKVLQPAESYALLTLEELKVILNLPLTDVSEDPQLQMWIDQYSDVIATMCNRVFAYEKGRGDLAWRSAAARRPAAVPDALPGRRCRPSSGQIAAR